jgi:glucose-1-phosphate thymidylyltransferase
MKGVILAGGLGTRLYPLTRVTNKHLLPVYNRPMIFYPLQALINAGITEIMIVTGGSDAGDFLRLLGNGRDFGLKHLNYTYQEGEGGIADALRLSEHFADGQKICVILGDNLIEKNVRAAAQRFTQQARGAHIILKEVPDPERFGVPVFEGETVVRIEEKPKIPKSRYAVTGIYFYDATVFDKIRKLKPSARGEMEITDVNNLYLEEGTLTYSILDGWWTDAGTFESLYRAGNFVVQGGANKLDPCEGGQPLPQARSQRQVPPKKNSNEAGVSPRPLQPEAEACAPPPLRNGGLSSSTPTAARRKFGKAVHGSIVENEGREFGEDRDG